MMPQPGHSRRRRAPLSLSREEDPATTTKQSTTTKQLELVHLALRLCDLADEVKDITWSWRLRRLARELIDAANQPPLRPSDEARRPSLFARRRAASRSA